MTTCTVNTDNSSKEDLKTLGDEFYSSFETIQSKITYDWLSDSYEKILEIGCSSGYFTKRLAKKSKQAYGLDVDQEHIEEAQQKYPDVHFQATNAGTGLPYEDNMFDAIVMLEVYEHVEDQQSLIKEVYRILKPGGILILTTPNTGLFSFLDAFNLKTWVIKTFPTFTKVVSKAQRYKGAQYTDNLTWHGHYSLQHVQNELGKKFEIIKVHRGGLLIFPLCGIIRGVLTRVFPSKFLLKCIYGLMNLDGGIPYGPCAYNLMIKARKNK